MISAYRSTLGTSSDFSTASLKFLNCSSFSKDSKHAESLVHIGVPFIARWPRKVASGRINNSALISAVDLLPTFCEVAGVELSATYAPDGVSQVAALMGETGREVKRSQPLFWKMNSAWPARSWQPDHWVSWAVVDQKWKLVANHDLSFSELYDLSQDALEKNNVAETNPEVRRQLLAKITDWQKTLPEKPSGDVFSKLRSEIQSTN